MTTTNEKEILDTEEDPQIEDKIEIREDIIFVYCTLVNTLIWITLFACFIWKRDERCQENKLSHFSKIAFYLLVACGGCEIVELIILYVSDNKSKGINIGMKEIPKSMILLILIDAGISLFIYIKAIIEIDENWSIVGCESLYYLILVYIIFITVIIVLIGLVFLIVCSCFLFDELRDQTCKLI